MSPESDLAFGPSDTLLLPADFSNLTEFDDYGKELFMSNAMEELSDGILLEEPDCKDDLKLIADVDEALAASLKARDVVMDSVKARDSPFAMFLDEETSDSLQLVDLTSQNCCSAEPTVKGFESMGLIHALDSSPGSTARAGLYTAILAARELNCLSLDELGFGPDNSPDSGSTLLSQSLSQKVSLPITCSEPAPSRAPLSSPLGKSAADTSLFQPEDEPLYSTNIVTPSIQIPTLGTSSSSSLSFTKSEGELKIALGGRDVPIINGPNITLDQSSSAKGRQVSTGSNALRFTQVSQGQWTHAPSLQRSQSSHALGQHSASHCLGPQADSIEFQPICKQEVPLLCPSNKNVFSLHQSSNTQGQSVQPACPSMRRVYSTGDLQSLFGMKVENSIQKEAASVKIGHYTQEERKMKLHRYRQKRTERNFSKKIKYACRKTLAENRPRVRGRFARSDEIGDSSLKGSDLPLIDEYEEVRSHRPRMVREHQAFYMANSSCVLSSNPIAQFWNTVGMKVAM